MKKGFVYLVGAGPGDPRLITLKGKQILEDCDAVVYDHLASTAFLSWVPSHCRILYVGKQAGQQAFGRFIPEVAMVFGVRSCVGDDVIGKPYEASFWIIGIHIVQRVEVV